MAGDRRLPSGSGLSPSLAADRMDRRTTRLGLPGCVSELSTLRLPLRIHADAGRKDARSRTGLLRTAARASLPALYPEDAVLAVGRGQGLSGRTGDRRHCGGVAVFHDSAIPPALVAHCLGVVHGLVRGDGASSTAHVVPHLLQIRAA